MRLLKTLAATGALITTAGLLASSASAAPAVTVVNPITHPVPVSGSVAVTNTVPVTVTSPVTVANPVSNVTVGNTTANPIPVTITGAAASSAPFYRAFVLSTSNSAAVTGLGTGTLNVGTLALTNSDPAPQQVSVFAAVMTLNGSCTSPSVVAASTSPTMNVYVQPYTTLVISYPTPLVFNPYPLAPTFGSGTATCIGAYVNTVLTTGTVEVDINGSAN